MSRAEKDFMPAPALVTSKPSTKPAASTPVAKTQAPQKDDWGKHQGNLPPYAPNTSYININVRFAADREFGYIGRVGRFAAREFT